MIGHYEILSSASPPSPPPMTPPWPPPEDPEPGDIRFASADNPRHERAYWQTLLADGEADSLALAVLHRLRLADDRPLLEIDPLYREAIDPCLRQLASSRLDHEPLRDRVFDRALGHPLELARLAFEERGYPDRAAALYALSHDELQASGRDHLALALLELRFAVARTLVLAGVEGEARRSCVRFVENVLRQLDALERVAASAGSVRLREDVTAWLDEDAS